MNEQRFQSCSVARAVDAIGDRWTFLILRESFFGVRRYNDFARNLGLSRAILSDRLQRLVSTGVLARSRYQRDPERYEYRLTPTGKDLYPAIITLMRWGDQHLADENGPPLVLRHRPCGHVATPTVVCSECGQPLLAQDVEPLPGPGAASIAEAQGNISRHGGRDKIATT